MLSFVRIVVVIVCADLVSQELRKKIDFYRYNKKDKKCY